MDSVLLTIVERETLPGRTVDGNEAGSFARPLVLQDHFF
jgi:hypothetical protein